MFMQFSVCLDEMLVFLLGIFVGVVSATVANQREGDNLRKLLKQNENLIQDLH